MRQRKDFVQKMYDLSIDDIYAGNSRQVNLFSTKSQLFSGADTSFQLSLPHTCVTGSLDLHIAEWIWKKAGRLLSQPKSVLPAPLKDAKIQAFSVISESGKVPHCVQIYANFKAACTCRNFKPKQICSHTVAVTEKEGALDKFVTWYKGQNIKGGLSSVATINVDTRASGRKQGPKRQRKTKENVDFVLPIPSTFLGIESITTKSSGATSGAPVAITATQQSSDSTSLPSTPALSNQNNAWNTSTFATFSSRRPRTQALSNASQSYQASSHPLLYQSTDLQPQHQAFPLTTEVSHVATTMGGACQDHPFSYPGHFTSDLRHPCLPKVYHRRSLLRSSSH